MKLYIHMMRELKLKHFLLENFQKYIKQQLVFVFPLFLVIFQRRQPRVFMQLQPSEFVFANFVFFCSFSLSPLPLLTQVLTRIQYEIAFYSVCFLENYRKGIIIMLTNCLLVCLLEHTHTHIHTYTNPSCCFSFRIDFVYEHKIIRNFVQVYNSYTY